MNKQLSLYYLSVVALLVLALILYFNVSNRDLLNKTGFNCILSEECPEKWGYTGEQILSRSQFLALLKLGHHLNATVQVNIENEELVLAQDFHFSCNDFEVFYFFSMKNDMFYLEKIVGLENYLSFLANENILPPTYNFSDKCLKQIY